MKHLLLAALLLPAVIIAQVPIPSAAQRLPLIPGHQSPRAAFPDNYELSLKLTDKDGAPLEVSVVVAASQFSASLSEQNLSFSGNVDLEDSASIMIYYLLDWQTPAAAIKDNGNGPPKAPPISRASGSVRLKPGEEVQIIRAGTRTAHLSIKKLVPTKAK